MFEIVETPEKKLKGRYWTERGATGEIILEFATDERWEELPEEMNIHPVTARENER